MGAGPSLEVTTLAGVGGQSGTGVDGTGAAARFHHPISIAFDATGNLVVADSAAHCIRYVTVKGEVSVLAGQPGKAGFADGKGSAALFDRPDSVCLDLHGRILCCDKGNHRIRMIQPETGDVTTLAGTGERGFADGAVLQCKFDSPTGIVVDWKARVVVADTGNHRIRRITPDGKIQTIAGSGEAGYSNTTSLKDCKFNHPKGLAFDRAARLLVCDSENDRIRRIGDGKVTTIAGLGLRGFGDGLALEAKLNHPTQCVVDRQGRLIICDSLNHRLRLLDTNGQLTTLVGGDRPGCADAAMGAQLSASFRLPMSVAADEFGHVLVADYGNHTVRLVTLEGAGPLKVHPRINAAVAGTIAASTAAGLLSPTAGAPGVMSPRAGAAAAAAATASPGAGAAKVGASPTGATAAAHAQQTQAKPGLPVTSAGKAVTPPTTAAVPVKAAAAGGSPSTAAGAGTGSGTGTTVKPTPLPLINAAAALSTSPPSGGVPPPPPLRSVHSDSIPPPPPPGPPPATNSAANSPPTLVLSPPSPVPNTTLATAVPIGGAVGATTAATKPATATTTAATTAAAPAVKVVGSNSPPAVAPTALTNAAALVRAAAAANAAASKPATPAPVIVGIGVAASPVLPPVIPLPASPPPTAPQTAVLVPGPPTIGSTLVLTERTERGPSRTAPRAPKIPAAAVNLFLHPASGAGVSGGVSPPSGTPTSAAGGSVAAALAAAAAATAAAAVAGRSTSPRPVVGVPATGGSTTAPQSTTTTANANPSGLLQQLPPPPPGPPPPVATATAAAAAAKADAGATSPNVNTGARTIGAPKPVKPVRAATAMTGFTTATSGGATGGHTKSPSLPDTLTDLTARPPTAASPAATPVPAPTGSAVAAAVASANATANANTNANGSAKKLPDAPLRGRASAMAAGLLVGGVAGASSASKLPPTGEHDVVSPHAPVRSLLSPTMLLHHRSGSDGSTTGGAGTTSAGSESDDPLSPVSPSGSTGSGGRHVVLSATATRLRKPPTPHHSAGGSTSSTTTAATPSPAPSPGPTAPVVVVPGKKPSSGSGSGIAGVTTGASSAVVPVPLLTGLPSTAVQPLPSPIAAAVPGTQAGVAVNAAVLPPVSTWVPGTVLAWLKMHHYAPQLVAFIEKDPMSNAIDGQLLLALDEQMLVDCGVENKLHRVKLLQGVALLKQRDSAAAAGGPAGLPLSPTAAVGNSNSGTPPPPPADTNPRPAAIAIPRASVVPPPPPPLEDDVPPSSSSSNNSKPAANTPPTPATPASPAQPAASTPGTPPVGPKPRANAEASAIFPSSLLAKLRSAPDKAELKDSRDSGNAGGNHHAAGGGKPMVVMRQATTAVGGASAAVDPRTLGSDDGKLNPPKAGKPTTAGTKPAPATPTTADPDAHKSDTGSGLHSSNGGNATPSMAAATPTTVPPPVQLTDQQARDAEKRRAIHAHSPLTAEEERRLAPLLPLGARAGDRANLDTFFALLRSFDRTKWQWVLEAHLYMVATLNPHVSDLLLHNWHVWLFPLMQRQNERQQLMDKEAERTLLSLVTLLISRVHFQKFMGDDARAPLPSSNAAATATAGSGAAGTAPSGTSSGSSTAAASSTDTSKHGGAEVTMATLLSTMVNHIASFVWDEGSCRVVRMILCSFFNLVLSAAQKNNLWRTNVTHPAWKNLFSSLQVVEDFVFFRPLGVSAMPSAGKKSKSVKMGLHLYHKGCVDIRLVQIVHGILKALPIEKLRVMEGMGGSGGGGGVDADVHKLQKTYQRAGMEATSFFSALSAYMEAAQELASKMTAGGSVSTALATAAAAAAAGAFSPSTGAAGGGATAVDPKTGAPVVGAGGGVASGAGAGPGGAAGTIAVVGGSAAAPLSREQQVLLNAQIALTRQCSGRKRFTSSGLFSNKGASDLKEMFDGVEAEIQRKKNSKIFQPAVSFASLQDRKGSRLMSIAHFEDPDELTRDDVIKLSEQCVGEPLGQGSFGRVYRVQLFGMTWACKIVPFAGLQSAPAIRSEIRVHRKLRARRCVLFRGAYTKPPNLIILTEFVGRGETLHDRIKAAATAAAVASSGSAGAATVPPPPPPEGGDAKASKPDAAAAAATVAPAPAPATAAASASASATSPASGAALTIALKLRIAVQIVEGLNELHHQNPPVVHRDLKPTNVLLDRQCNVKLCDFGFSHPSQAANAGVNFTAPTAGSSVADDDDDDATASAKVGSPTGVPAPVPGSVAPNKAPNKAGTPLYKAPEAWDSDPDRNVGTASDVYSFGIVLHELFCGRLPWSTKRVDQIAALHLHKKQPPPPDPELVQSHARVAAIFESCTRHDEKKRPTSEQLLSMVRGLYAVYQVPPDDE